MRIRLLVTGLAVTAIVAATASARDRDDDPPSECKTAYGQTACGYHCTAGYGTVACAETPSGACLAAYGKTTCWDPPRHYRHRAREHAPSACLAGYGEIACGYDCVAGYGEVRCSPRPGGRCVAASGHVTCTE